MRGLNMTQVKNWSDEQVISVFDALGLNYGNEQLKNSLNLNFVVSVPTKQIYLPKLSDSSVPPPTGRITNANLENTSK